MADEIARITVALERGLADVEAAFAHRSDAQLSRHRSAEAWCAKQILGHLIEAEGEVFGALIPGLAGRPAPPGWDAPPSMVRAGDCVADAAFLLARFRALRLDGIALARALASADLPRTSDRNWHKGPTETVGDLLRHWPEHTAEHLAQAEATLTDD
ncbi:MAG: DinB family protein [Chloroflexota bacterium]|nr:DinB family protein [Chloroflexota bacterium]